MTETNTYDIGDVAVVTGTFRTTATDALVNPTTVTVKVTDPSGNTATGSGTNTSTGIYTYDITLDEAGEWYYRFEGTGAAQAAGEGVLFVRARKVT